MYCAETHKFPFRLDQQIIQRAVFNFYKCKAVSGINKEDVAKNWNKEVLRCKSEISPSREHKFHIRTLLSNDRLNENGIA